MPWFRAGLSAVLLLFGALALIPYALRGGPLVAALLLALALAASFGLARASVAGKGARAWLALGLGVPFPAALAGLVLGWTIAHHDAHRLGLAAAALALLAAGLAGAWSARAR